MSGLRFTRRSRTTLRSGIYGFHTPGHKGGRFAAPELTELVGKSGLALDLPAMTATDNTFHPTDCVRDAQAAGGRAVRRGGDILPDGRLDAGDCDVALGGCAAGRDGGAAAEYPSVGRGWAGAFGSAAAVRDARCVAGVRGAGRDGGGACSGARCGAEAGGGVADAAELLRAGAGIGASG